MGIGSSTEYEGYGPTKKRALSSLQGLLRFHHGATVSIRVGKTTRGNPLYYVSDGSNLKHTVKFEKANDYFRAYI